MNTTLLHSILIILLVWVSSDTTNLYGQNLSDNREFKVFQFPADKIPRIDGNTEDWEMVPESYTVGMDQVWDDSGKHSSSDTTNLNFNVKVGWVKGENRLYFLYEAYDNYWDFEQPGLHNDTFELIVDADQSGGPFIHRFHPNKKMDIMDAYFSYHGVQAQNYHIFTPAYGKDWTLVWGSQPWIKELPYANAATNYDFSFEESGKLVLEFWITPFDYAGNSPERSIVSQLLELKKINLCWAVIDYDDKNKEQNNGFWNLSKEHKMYGNSSYALPFILMPLEPQFQKELQADWDFMVIDEKLRKVAFKDDSIGEVNSWLWDFGDGNTSKEQHPIHHYKKEGKYIVVLTVQGPKGSSRKSKIWDVALK